MEEVSGRDDINVALRRVYSEKVDERGAGLVELKKTIYENRGNPKLTIKDIGFHTILEAVFRVARLEIPNYLKASKYTKSKVESRLYACAGVVRIVVDVGLKVLRYKTVKALVEHIIQTLPTADDGYCEPLLRDYFKALSALLGYTAHPEHFSKDEWRNATDFCLQTVRNLKSSSEPSTPNLSNISSARNGLESRGRQPSRPATPLSTREQSQRCRSDTSQSTIYLPLREIDRELLLCLQHLTFVSNAPVCDRASEILTVLVELLQSYSRPSTIQQSAFDSINSLMSHIVTSNISLALQIMKMVIPMLRRFWVVKEAMLKEALLVFLTYGEILLPRLISVDEMVDHNADLQALVDILRNDYCIRRSREQLQLDDLILSNPSRGRNEQMPLGTRILGVRVGAHKAEHPWCLISTSAGIIITLEADINAREQAIGSYEPRNVSKRPRISHPLEDIFQYAKGTSPTERLYALQVLVFVFDLAEFEESVLQCRLNLLLNYLSDEDGLAASWTMLAITSAAGQNAAFTAGLKSYWLQLWRIVARYITSSSTCRAACHLLAVTLVSGLVQYNEVADLVDGMTRAVDLNGPADCDESATTLWTIIVILRGQQNLNSAFETSESVLRWLFNRWSPANLRDRQHAAYISQHFSVVSTLRVACICLGLPAPSAGSCPAVNLGPLFQTRLRCLQDRKLMQYLLLTRDGSLDKGHTQLVSNLESSEIKLANMKYQTLGSIVAESLAAEGLALLRGYFASPTELASGVNRDIIRNTISFSIVGYSLLESSRLQDVRSRKQLEGILNELRTSIKECLLFHNERRDLINGVFETFGANIGLIRKSVLGRNLLVDGAIVMSQGFDQEFWHRVLHDDALTSVDGQPDGMDLDGGYGSQTSNRREVDPTLGNCHHEVASLTNGTAFRACIAAKICFMSQIPTVGESRFSIVPQAAQSLVKYLTSLKAQDFLLCRSFVRELLDSGIPIAESDANQLLEYLAQGIIRPYQLERSEVSMGFCLDVMTGLAEMWTAEEDSEIAYAGEQLYTWFINIVLKKGIASPHLHTCISSMLQKVIKVRPEYARSLSLPSARTCLFEVLREGNTIVKFHIGNSIASIFGLFVLAEHENIFEDVKGSLPTDPGWIEGIALRLLILSHLAASWSTLLRRGVYAIFETSAHVPDSTGYASNCLEHISTTLALATVQDLFKIFVSQLVYTWLERQPLKSIPFSAFGYATLAELLRDVQDDIVGQVVMRGNDDAAEQLVGDLGLDFEKLLELSFSKAAAYCIARDVALPDTLSTQAPGADTRLRKTLGKERYSSLVTTHFAKILTLLFKSMDTDGQVEKSLQHPSLTEARASYHKMVPNGNPSRALPLNQQPSFKAKFLFNEIERLCQRTSYDAESLWSPALYVYVFREILNDIRPALGSLHACSVLRRIRILVCLAGDTALKHYPLEMTLHSLKPFLTDAQCAEDTIGTFQYLLANGSPYLKDVPSFLAGLAVSTLTSMRAFFDSTQDSTTQESQFKATMSSAQAFHAWFVSFLEKYTSRVLSEESVHCFKRIVKAASKIQNGGNARKGTYESELLLELLEDQRSGRDLLNESSKNAIMKFLCTTFETPSDFRDDVLGSDEQAARYASTVWKTCQMDIVDANYLLWAGRVLGRAYAGKGLVDREMVVETHFGSELKEVSLQPATSASSSRTHLLQLLCNILSGDNSKEVGMAENSLRYIVTAIAETEYYLECERFLPPHLSQVFFWRQFPLPTIDTHHSEALSLQRSAGPSESQPALEWIQKFCLALALSNMDDPILSNLAPVLKSVEGFAEKAFQYILHIVLLKEAGGHQTTRRIVSEACHRWFQRCSDEETNEDAIYGVRILLRALLYLRTQPRPYETAKTDRAQWLEIDYKQAASVAVTCCMFKTALLYLEIDYSEAAKASRRSSAIKIQEPTNLLLEIYEHIDEQDAYYGVQQPSSLSSMMTRLEYEHAGFQSLSFRGAHYDGQIRQLGAEHQIDEESMVRVLDSLDLNGLSQSLLRKVTSTGPNSTDCVLRTARKLEQWDISAPVSQLSSSSTIFRVFQGINNAADSSDLLVALNNGFKESMHQLLSGKIAKSSMHTVLASLAIVTEADEVFFSRRSEQLYEISKRFEDRDHWMYSESFEHINGIISCRETIFSSLSKRSKLQDLLKISQRDARSLESQNLLTSSRMSRLHGALQNALTTTTYLTHLVKLCVEAGVDITAATRLESANVLWGQGEMTASIKMLQDLEGSLDPDTQFIHVGKPELLAKIGYQISKARLEKPEEIIERYLVPAINELRGLSEGDEAGEVFHEFASFCDQQLQNGDSLEDFERIQRLRDRKEGEVRGLEKMMRSASSQGRERDNLKSHLAKAKQWFNLDDMEFQRLHQSRQTFLRQSLENYLLCLKACDKHDNDALRFSALWLENYNSDIANDSVARHVGQVGSRKFAPLMNQWSSRLLDNDDQFQSLLTSLVFRICVDHPYHGMYQIFAGSKTKGGKDETALARFAAANNIVHQLKASPRASLTWFNIHNTNVSFAKFAQEKPADPSIKQGSKVPLRKSAAGQRMEQDILKQKVPPPTIKIDLRPDGDYRNVPMIARFQPEFSLATGISAPKIITAIGTDGLKYKQLLKSGSDDLRQDSIMEQVFEQVSRLLQTQRATRQRKLGIRTYKVLPLTPQAGIIEFVPNTLPLHDYLSPAHQNHFPKDLKPNVCRKHIGDAQNKSVDQRIKVFRGVCDKFHPVLRYFFMERFENPDDWFEKRLAYTRSTAAISILGHILGLGDRHQHNILLDEKTGEVVHIDLGIAFEQGRVLPVPELVPFRLTRDLVDGMGITKTEGVFRRCCEFTLEALRNESYSIMTILDVLRYDPLYSWSLSPLRLKKMQDAQTENPAIPAEERNAEGKPQEEPGEADRALTVVKKKLSKSLSVTATVNELIQMATDERNLAVLFCGWAAYA